MSPGTPFADILARTVRDLPGARGAIFVDWEGEAVDAYSRRPETDIRLIGAHWGIIHNQVRAALRKLGQGQLQEIVLRFDDRQVIIHRVDEGYMAVMTMDATTHLGRALVLIRAAASQLRAEM